jgi:hypothetical protein
MVKRLLTDEEKSHQQQNDGNGDNAVFGGAGEIAPQLM